MKRLAGAPAGIANQMLETWRAWIAMGASTLGDRIDREVQRACRAMRVAGRRDVNRLKAEIARLRERIEELQSSLQS
jgi:polyhydroxyalkanoate synthesis regulator phasin